jgi:hypothetical protein
MENHFKVLAGLGQDVSTAEAIHDNSKIKCYKQNMLKENITIDMNSTLMNAMKNLCIDEKDLFIDVVDKFALLEQHSIKNVLALHDIDIRETVDDLEKKNNIGIYEYLSMLFTRPSQQDQNQSENDLNHLDKNNRTIRFNLKGFIEILRAKFEALSQTFDLNGKESFEDNLKRLNYSSDKSMLHFVNDFIQPVNFEFVNSFRVVQIELDVKLEDLSFIANNNTVLAYLNSIPVEYKTDDVKSSHSTLEFVNVYGRSPKVFDSNAKFDESTLDLAGSAASGITVDNESLIQLGDLLNIFFFDLNVSFIHIVEVLNNYTANKIYCLSGEYYANDPTLCPAPSRIASNYAAEFKSDVITNNAQVCQFVRTKFFASIFRMQSFELLVHEINIVD